MQVKSQDCYFIAAGEYSGDILAADLVHALREFFPNFCAFGIVGEHMRQAAVEEILAIDELSIMGISEVIKKLPLLRMFELSILQKIDRLKPRFAILVDNPGFNLRLAEQLRLRGIPVIQYVAPKLWAWGISRIQQLQRDFDLVLGILPFEQEFFETHRVRYQYVGNPHVDRSKKVVISSEQLGMGDIKKIVALLPGSRHEELNRILPDMVKIKHQLHKLVPDCEFILPLTPILSFEDVVTALRRAGVEVSIHQDDSQSNTIIIEGIRVVKGMSLEVMSCADVALVASGTATLECALQDTPMVVMYQMSSFTYQIAKKVVSLPYVSLVNLICGKQVVKEFIQDYSLSDIVRELKILLEDQALRAQMLGEFEKMKQSLQGNAAYHAAKAIFDYLNQESLSFQFNKFPPLMPSL